MTTSGPSAVEQDLARLSLVDFLDHLHRADIEVWAEGERLRFSAPKGGLPPELRAELVRRKPELLTFLQQVGAGDEEPLEPQPREGPPPLSYAQERLWFFDQLEPGSSAYNLFQAIELAGPLSVRALGRSLDAVRRRHEVLRTTFGAAGESASPVQIIHPPAARALPVVDLSRLPGKAAGSVADALAVEERRRPFDLGRGPLVRAWLLRLPGDAGAPASHRFLITQHHIVSDGFSTGLLIRELAVLYPFFEAAGFEAASFQGDAKVRAAELPELPRLPVQYADYAIWQRRRMTEEGEAERQLEHWRQRLEGAPELLELPLDRPRAPGGSCVGGAVRHALPADLSRAAEAFGRRFEATPFMVLLAVAQLLLGRWCGQLDVVLGTPVANRNRAEIEPLLGFFVNTLALRTRLRGAESFEALVQRVRTQTLADFAHQDLPFERLVEELAPRRSAVHTPIFQVFFALQNASRPRLAAGGLELRSLPSPPGAEIFDLELNLNPEANGALSLGLRYARRLFDAATMERLARRFEVLLAGALEAPETPVRRLPQLSPAERRQLMAEVTSGSRHRAEGGEPSLFSRLGRVVSSSPDAPALTLVSGGEEAAGESWNHDERWSYRGLAVWVERCARSLASRGVGPGQPVALALERSPALVAALLGAWRAGAVTVPLDPQQPAARLRQILDDASGGAEDLLLVVEEELPPGLDAPAGTRVVRRAELLEEGAAADGAHSLGALPPEPGGEDPAYVLFTSGTTGRPKGVVVSHGNLQQTLAASQERFRLDADDRAAVLAAPVFDIFLFELLPTLLAGGEAVLFSRSAVRAMEPVVEALPALTRLHAVPALMAQLTAAAAARETSHPRLRSLFVGGDRVPPALLAQMRAAFGPAVGVHVLYGPTEDTIICASQAVEEDGAAPGALVGRPLPGAVLRVVDRWGDEAPFGAPGEIVLGGAGVSAGYLGRPTTTAAVFVPDAAPGAPPGARAYRTGDRARRRADGVVEFLGRLDHQLKIRGFRIEAGEVETRLEELPEVAEAVVLGRDDGAGGQRLVAWVGAAEGATPDAAELRRHLAAALPEYMVPSAIVVLDALPLTANGKVDRKALPDPEMSAGEGVAPRTATEEILAGLFSEVLGTAEVGVTDDFFQLGGHSLLATRLAGRIRDAFEAEVGVQAIFEDPTVEGLAGRLAGLAGSAEAEPVLPKQREGTEPGEGPEPLSFAQQRLWFLDRLDPGSTAYNMPAVLHCRGALDPAVLARVFTEIMRRHEILRTRFQDQAEGPVQVVAAPAPVPLPVVDLRNLPESAVREEGYRLAAREAAQPFDLERGPVLRTRLVRLGKDDHLLLLDLHHIVSDGWSMGVLMGELTALYQAFAGGDASLLPVLPELPVQYADYARWQRRRLTEERLTAELEIWRRRLAGAPEVLELPTDRPRPSVPSYRGASVPVRLGAEASERLEELSRALGATPFMLLLAAFQALLGRWSGQDQVVVGSPVAGRPRRELEGLVGFFVNTLPLRLDLAGDPSFTALVQRLRPVALEAYAHGEIPFERLVEELAPRRQSGVPPLFQVVFALQNAPGGEIELPGLTLEPWAPPARTAKFDLTLSLSRHPQGFAGSLELDRDLFDRTTARRLAASLEAVLAAVAATPELPLSRWPWSSAAQRHQLLVEWRGIETGYPRESSLPELFGQTVSRCADVPALVPVDASADPWSYGRLATWSRRLARYLRQLGLRRGDRVAVLLDREPRLVGSLLAILEAGGAYVPLDPALPESRLRLLIEDSGAAILITAGELPGALSQELAEKLPHLPTMVDVEASGELLEELDDAPLGLPLDASDLAYIIYTSGSTGRPKGVAVPHRAVARLVLEAGWARLAADQTFLLLAPVSFDASTLEIWGALLHGAPLVLFEERVPSVVSLKEALGRHRVSFLWLTTGLFNMVMDEDPAALAEVGQVLTGGDVGSPPHMRRLLAMPGTRTLTNAYGPTENTTFTTCHGMTRPQEVQAPVSVGRPIEDTEVVILGRDGVPAPVGVAGELCAGGDGLAWGYFGDPRRTAQAFVPRAQPRRPGDRLYRTGDRARFLADGRIDFLGRFDFQVKIRGFRIEPGEIQAVLADHRSVAQAVVLARSNAAGDKRLLAWVVPEAPREGEEAVSPADLEELLVAHLSQQLPAYMVPDAVMALAELPLTANGKIDRRALPDPETTAGLGEPPATPSEELLAEIWQDLLSVPSVARQDDFFELGGHSLLATRLASRLRDAAGVDLALRAIFDHPTLEDLGRALDAAREEAQDPVLPAPGDEPRPLSFAQQRLWFLDRLEGASAAYNLPTALELEGRLQPAALATALAAVARRHESLRTTFREGPSGPLQIVAPPGPVPLPVVDLSRLPEAAAREIARRLGAAEAGTPFDLERGPLLRALLLRLGGEHHVFVANQHHAVSDGWSMGIFVREIAAAYRGAVAAPERSPRELPDELLDELADELASLPVQYGDYSLWQRRRLDASRLAAEVEHWRRQLEGAPQRLELPVDHPRPAVQSYRGATVPVRLPAALAERLDAVAREGGATLFMVLLAGWATVLARWSGQRDLLVGSPVAGRVRSELEGLIGFFVNTLVLRLDLRADPGFAGAVEQARHRALDAYAHQELPFERLVEELAPQRDLSAQPLFQVFLSLQNMPSEPLELPDLDLTPVATGSAAAKFDLSLTLGPRPEGSLEGSLEYAADLFDATTVQRLAGHLERLLNSAVEDSRRPVSTLGLLSAAEEHQLLRELNGAPGRVPLGELPTLHRRFLEQAARTPDATALVAAGEELSYRELEARSRRLAGRLAAVGVGTEVAVGVCLPRRADLVVSLLAVLRAGGAYVPLDPAYPEERIELMMEDSRAPVVVTDETQAARFEAPHFRGARFGDGGLRVLFADSAAEPAGEGTPDSVPVSPRGFSLDERARPENLAYFIYTSGSTGRPKGVAIEHRSASRMVEWALERFPPEVTAGTLAATSVCFDLSIYEIFMPLARGSAVILADNALSLLTLPEAVRRRVTLVNTVPSAMAVLVREEGVPEGVRGINLAGEPLARSLADAVHALPGVGALYDLYGPSEDTTYSTEERVERDTADPPRIGRPLTGTRGYVLAPDFRPLPRGARGELFLAGDGLSRQYFRRPALTAASYLPDPYGGEAGGRMYRTGDLVRYLADGRLDYLGRRDHQVKLRGFRIELGEIETVIRSHPAVAMAAVAVRTRGGEASLVAYLEPRPETELDAELDTEELQRWLGERLPAHMVPSLLVVLDALPLNPNGKIDRKALPEVDAPHKPQEPPATVGERLLAGIWCELLGRDAVYRQDSFFELGGHSLLATRVVSRLRQETGVELSLRRLFDHPTLEALARHLEQAEGQAVGGALLEPIPLEPVPRDGEPLPLSFAQERLWFLDRLEGASATYNMPAPLRLRGLLRPARLAAALSAVSQRHEVLRTLFPPVADDAESEGAPRLVILPPRPVPLPAVDLSRLPSETAEEMARGLAAEEAARPFDLARGPLLRALLVRLARDHHLLMTNQHHIVSDGWSMGLFVGEVARLYGEGGETDALPPLPVQYADYAAWQRRRLTGEVLAAEVEHWRRELAGAPQHLDLPTDRPRPERQSHRGASVPVRLPAVLGERLEALGREHGATLFMVLLAAFSLLLARWSGQRDLLLGTPVAGRLRRELEPLLGFFVNTLVLRMDLGAEAGEATFAALLAQARRRVLDAHAHQEVPFERLVEALAPRRDLSRQPLFQVLLALRNTPGEGAALPGLEVEPVGVAGTSAKFDLTLNLGEAADEGGSVLVGGLEYAVDLFDRSTIEDLRQRFQTLLESVVEAPEAPLAELGWLPPQERSQMVAEEVVAPEAAVKIVSPRVAQRPPADETEGALVELFGELLDSDQATPTSDFFALGGTSLMAVRVMARIRRRLGVSLPVATLFSHPTPEALALLVRGQSSAAEGSLVQLRPGEGPPLVLIHPIGGQVLCYAPLARQLDPQQPIVSFQASPEGSPDTLEELAADYLRTLREHQPDGPYRLAGWSMGGVVAYEMARQLEAVGKEVEPLVLIDPQLPPMPEVDEATLLGRFGLDLLASRPGAAVAPEALAGLDPRGGLEGLLRRAHRRGLLPEDLALEDVRAAWEIFRRHHRLLVDYRPEGYTGPATLLRAVGSPDARGPVDAAGWRRLLPELKVVDLEGDHYSLVLGPPVGEVAQRLSEALETPREERP
ncbi:MAG: amino acid adenylation domain-containing protein [Acidobacteriota bacterium]|nr:amino acid adenylation domain-containing protein [Acidobacteriota bacterium]